jgi:hypothetical protein
MSGLETLALVAGLGGSAVSAVGQIQQGKAANAAAEQDALNAEAASREERAASQRDAIDKRKEAQIVMSRQQALAAASGAGAGADAPTIVRLMSDTASQGELNAQTAMFGGESRAQGFLQTAKSRRAEGKASLLGSQIGAFGAVLSGLSSAGTGYSQMKRRG